MYRYLLIFLLSSIFVPDHTPTTSHQPYIRLQKLLASDAAADAAFGSALAMSYDAQILVVGAPLHDVSGHSDQGQVYIYQRDGNQWHERQTLTASDGAANDNFGAAIAIANAPHYTIVIGAPNNDVASQTNLGSAYVFDYNGTTWAETTILPINDPNAFANDNRGTAVAINQDSSEIVVGAPGVDVPPDAPGTIYTFVPNGDTWQQEQRIVGPVGGRANLGSNLIFSHDGHTLFVAGLYAKTAIISFGAVHIYQKIADTWSYDEMLAPSDGIDFDEFGQAIDISEDGNTLLIGAPGHGTGQAYTFTSGGATWNETDTLSRPDTFYSTFGQAVQLDGAGETAAVGAWLNGSGAIHRYENSGSNWVIDQTLITLDSRQEHLGYAIAMSQDGTMIAGGARSAHSGAPFDNVGAVYTYIPGFDLHLPLIVR